MSYVVGLDLGQAADWTALAILKSSDSRQTTLDGTPLLQFDCVHLERFPKGTAYPAIVARVVRLLADDKLQVGVDRPRLVIDATGVGRPVVDLFLDARPDAEVSPLTITGGDTVREDRWNNTGVQAFWVPKKELVGSVQSGLQSGRLKFVPTLELAETLKRELLSFRVKVSISGNESFEAWREKDHDDLILAVSLAVWLGSRPVHYASWGPSPFDRRGVLNN